MPDLDDEFVKDVSEFDTLDQLRDNARKKMTETAEAAADEDFINSIMDKMHTAYTTQKNFVRIRRFLSCTL